MHSSPVLPLGFQITDSIFFVFPNAGAQKQCRSQKHELPRVVEELDSI